MKEGIYIGMRLGVIRKSIASCCVLSSCLVESVMENRGISGLIVHC